MKWMWRCEGLIPTSSHSGISSSLQIERGGPSRHISGKRNEAGLRARLVVLRSLVGVFCEERKK